MTTHHARKHLTCRTWITTSHRSFTLLLGGLMLASGLAHSQERAPLRLTATIPMPNVKGRIDHMDADVKGKRLFIAGLENGSVEVVAVKAGKWLRSIPGFLKPQGVWYVPGLNKLSVASDDDSMIRVFRADTFALLDSIKPELGPNRIIYDPHTKNVYVGYGGKDAGKNYGELGIIDARTNKHVGDGKVAAHPAPAPAR